MVSFCSQVVKNVSMVNSISKGKSNRKTFHSQPAFQNIILIHEFIYLNFLPGESIKRVRIHIATAPSGYQKDDIGKHVI